MLAVSRCMLETYKVVDSVCISLRTMCTALSFLTMENLMLKSDRTCPSTWFQPIDNEIDPNFPVPRDSQPGVRASTEARTRGKASDAIVSGWHGSVVGPSGPSGLSQEG